MSALPELHRPSLEEAIAQMITLGEKDPLTIARKCADLYGSEWVAVELAANWEEIFAEIARQKLGNNRRAAIVSIGDRARQGKVGKRDAVLASLYIPSKGWITLGHASRADLAEAEAYRRRLASGLNLWADWYRDTRERMEAQGVDEVRKLRGELPPLPPKGELEAAS